MINISFIKSGANSAIGGFASGDKMRCGEALAQHFVETGVAEYAEVKVAVLIPVTVKPKGKAK